MKSLAFHCFLSYLLAASGNTEALDLDEWVKSLTFGNKSTYGDLAALYCEDRNLTGLRIESKEKNDALFKYLSKNDDKTYYWTGAYRKGFNGPFRWSNGDRIGFRNFPEGRPIITGNRGKSPKFFSIHNNGSDVVWNDGTSSVKHNFICEPVTKSTVPAPPDPYNPYGITFTTYQIQNLDSTLGICPAGKRPLKIDSKEKADIIVNIMKANDDGMLYYLPMQRGSAKLPYKWLNGSEITYSNWATHHPKNNDKELCADFTLYPRINEIKWMSSNCYQSRSAACEDDPDQKTTTTPAPTTETDTKPSEADTLTEADSSTPTEAVTSEQSSQDSGDTVVGASDLDEWIKSLTFDNKTTYHSLAQRYCEKQNLTLLRIESKEKNDALFKYLNKNDYKAYYWIGAHREGFNGPFRWPNGDRLGFRNIPEGRMITKGKTLKSFKFFSIHNNGSDVVWFDASETDKYETICEPITKSTVPAPPEPDNPYGITFTTYKMKTFKSVMDRCPENKRPLRIDSKEKAKIVAGMMKANDDGMLYYLPMQRESAKLPYKWLNGSEITYSNWAAHHPKNKDKELCADFTLYPLIDELKWMSSNCDQFRPIACEDDPDQKTTTTTRPTTEAETTSSEADAPESTEASKADSSTSTEAVTSEPVAVSGGGKITGSVDASGAEKTGGCKCPNVSGGIGGKGKIGDSAGGSGGIEVSGDGNIKTSGAGASGKIGGSVGGETSEAGGDLSGASGISAGGSVIGSREIKAPGDENIGISDAGGASGKIGVGGQTSKAGGDSSRTSGISAGVPAGGSKGIEVSDDGNIGTSGAEGASGKIEGGGETSKAGGYLSGASGISAGGSAGGSRGIEASGGGNIGISGAGGASGKIGVGGQTSTAGGDSSGTGGISAGGSAGGSEGIKAPDDEDVKASGAGEASGGIGGSVSGETLKAGGDSSGVSGISAGGYVGGGEEIEAPGGNDIKASGEGAASGGIGGSVGDKTANADEDSTGVSGISACSSAGGSKEIKAHGGENIEASGTGGASAGIGGSVGGKTPEAGGDSSGVSGISAGGSAWDNKGFKSPGGEYIKASGSGGASAGIGGSVGGETPKAGEDSPGVSGTSASSSAPGIKDIKASGGGGALGEIGGSVDGKTSKAGGNSSAVSGISAGGSAGGSKGIKASAGDVETSGAVGASGKIEGQKSGAVGIDKPEAPKAGGIPSRGARLG